ncbi:hypothetical protein ABPG72_013311 [Tetrahymena utriculariae]
MSNTNQDKVQEYKFDINQISNKIFIVPLKNFIYDVCKYSQVEKNVLILLDCCINRLQESHLESIGEAIAELQKVHLLKISFGSIEIFDMFLEGQYKQGQAKLKGLQINTKISDRSFFTLCKHLKTFFQRNKSTLKSFCLDIPNLCNVTCQSVVDLSSCLSLLSTCSNLEELQIGLSHWNVQEQFDQSFIKLCGSLKQIIQQTRIKKLTLNFAGWNITDLSIQALSYALSAFSEIQTLKELNLNFTLVFRCQQQAVDSLIQAFDNIFPYNKLNKFYLCLNSWEFQKLESLSRVFLNLKDLNKLSIHLNSKTYSISESEDSKIFMKNILQLVSQNLYFKLNLNFPKCDQNNQQLLKEIEKAIQQRSAQMQILLNQFHALKSNTWDFYRKEIMWDAVKLLNKDSELNQQNQNNINFHFN